MRSRTIREGSVGLLILVGLAVFVGLVLWIRNIGFNNSGYKFFVNFVDAVGMKEGATVRYRGATVGKITEVKPQTTGVDTTVQITAPNLLIPKNVTIEANQAGFVGETSIDITPQRSVPAAQSANRQNQCNSALFICNNERVKGQVGVSFIALLQSGTDLAARYSDPAFFNNVNALTKNASIAASEVSRLTAELSILSRTARGELGTFSTTARSLSSTANQTLAQVGTAANRFGGTAEQYSLTATQLNRLVASANDLVVKNRSNLIGTLDSVHQTSDQLRTLLSGLTPAVAQVNSTFGQLNSAAGKLNTAAGQVNIAGVLRNLETLSANAAQASANLRDITTSLNNPNNAVLLQQTLDSARTTFENTQKITSDLDELTGDPAFRENVRKLVNGLGKLVSSTQQLQQQVQVAQSIEPLSTMINTTVSNATPSTPATPQPEHHTQQASPSTPPSTPQQLLLMPPAPKKSTTEATSQVATDTERKNR